MKLNIICVLCISLLTSSICISAEKKVYGLYENIQLPDIDLEIPAKLDTGA
ncbi:hypothetical protein ALO45_200082 [Pseudomonas syringae pv. syringae]|nr:hypothetical protein ALO45_200082 [Pseudomonas syringae pv. syringae]